MALPARPDQSHSVHRAAVKPQLYFNVTNWAAHETFCAFMLLSLSSPRRPSWFLRAYPTLPPLGGGRGGVNHFAGCMLVTATWTFCLSFRWVKRAHRVIQLPLGLLFFFFYLIPTYMPRAKNLQCGWVLLFVRWCRSFAGISNRANMLVAQSRRGVRSARRSPILYTTRFWAGVYVPTLGSSYVHDARRIGQ